jgi:hypothetical protein
MVLDPPNCKGFIPFIIGSSQGLANHSSTNYRTRIKILYLERHQPGVRHSRRNRKGQTKWRLLPQNPILFLLMNHVLANHNKTPFWLQEKGWIGATTENPSFEVILAFTPQDVKCTS